MIYYVTTNLQYNERSLLRTNFLILSNKTARNRRNILQPCYIFTIFYYFLKFSLFCLYCVKPAFISHNLSWVDCAFIGLVCQLYRKFVAENFYLLVITTLSPDHSTTGPTIEFRFFTYNTTSKLRPYYRTSAIKIRPYYRTSAIKIRPYYRTSAIKIRPYYRTSAIKIRPYYSTSAIKRFIITTDHPP